MTDQTAKPSAGELLTPERFVDDILSACDASNWDSEMNKGDYFKGLSDAYETIQEIANEFQAAMYSWTKALPRIIRNRRGHDAMTTIGQSSDDDLPHYQAAAKAVLAIIEHPAPTVEELAEAMWENTHDGRWDDPYCAEENTRNIYRGDAEVALRMLGIIPTERQP